MKIAVFTDAYLPKIDGVSISVERFSRELAARGHEFHIFVPEYSSPSPQSPGVTVVPFPGFSLPSYPDVKVVLPSRGSFEEAINFEPDVVHVQSPGPVGLYGMMFAGYRDLPVVGTYHTLVYEQLTYLSPSRLLNMPRLLEFMRISTGPVWNTSAPGLAKNLARSVFNRLYGRCHLIISPSDAIRIELQKHGVKIPIEVISNGLVPDQYDETPRDFPGGNPRLAYVGRVSYEKNCEIVLRAFAKLRESRPGAVLRFIGDGPALEDLKEEARKLGVAESVDFPGFLPHDRLKQTYGEIDLMLTASTMETQGMAVLEGLATGLPCVAVDAYALPELVRDGYNGYIVPPFDPDAMAARALDALASADRYKTFCLHSREIATEHELTRSVDRLESVYRRMPEFRDAARSGPPDEEPEGSPESAPESSSTTG